MLPYDVVGASSLPFGSREPDRIVANGIIPDDNNDVGDVAIGMTMTFTIDDDDNESYQRNRVHQEQIILIVDLLLRSWYLAESSEVTMYGGRRG